MTRPDARTAADEVEADSGWSDGWGSWPGEEATEEAYEDGTEPAPSLSEIIAAEQEEDMLLRRRERRRAEEAELLNQQRERRRLEEAELRRQQRVRHRPDDLDEVARVELPVVSLEPLTVRTSPGRREPAASAELTARRRSSPHPIAARLGSRATLQQAFILSEVLGPPRAMTTEQEATRHGPSGF